MLVKSENYMTIQGWMRTDLELSGNKLLVYAVIYGFTQSAQGKFTGSRQYLADWCGCSKQTIQTVLGDLVETGLIVKTEHEQNGVKYCEYSANRELDHQSKNLTGQSKNLTGPSQKTLLYNIADNKEDTKEDVSNDTPDEPDEVSPLDDDVASKMYSKEDFIGSGCRGKAKKKSPQPPKKNLYQKCRDANSQFSGNAITVNMLDTYLQLRLAMKDKPIYGVEQWQALLDKLSELSSDDRTDQKIIKQSIERGWAAFFPIDDKKRSNYHKNGDTDMSGNAVVFSRKEEDDDDTGRTI